jgi:hypothetical protein
LVGKPFADRGRGPFRYDCFGLFLALARASGIELNDPFTETSIDRDDYRMFYRNFQRLPRKSNLQRLDLLYAKHGNRQHVVTVLDGVFALDTSRATGAIRRQIREARYDEVFRLKCMA